MKTDVLRRSIALALLCSVAACEGGRLGARETGALGGTAVGAGIGAIIGQQTGHAGGGVAIGSVVGALAGGLIGNEVEKENVRMDQASRRIDQNQARLDENQRLIDELRNKGVDVRETSRGIVVNLPDVLFAFDSYELAGSSRRDIEEIAAMIERGDATRKISVEGHTDTIGGDAYNLRLSERRAESVAQALESRGVSSRRIRTRGFGKHEPVASNSTEAGRSKNRRVEVILENN